MPLSSSLSVSVMCLSCIIDENNYQLRCHRRDCYSCTAKLASTCFVWQTDASITRQSQYNQTAII